MGIPSSAMIVDVIRCDGLCCYESGRAEKKCGRSRHADSAAKTMSCHGGEILWIDLGGVESRAQLGGTARNRMSLRRPGACVNEKIVPFAGSYAIMQILAAWKR